MKKSLRVILLGLLAALTVIGVSAPASALAGHITDPRTCI